MNKELEKIRKEFNAKIDALIKPEFEVGKIYKDPNSQYLIFITELISDKYARGYGFNMIGEWMPLNNLEIFIYGFIPYPSELWLEALTKEAVKNYKGKKFIESRTNNNKYDFDKDFEHFYFNGNNLCIKNAGNGTLFHNGIWATVIKERSLEEWYEDWWESGKSLKGYIKSTKTELIQILKNLD